jgi:hypothetical protein
MQWTTSIPLSAGAPDRLEAEHVEYLLDGDFGADSVEIDSWHGFPRKAAKRR